MRFLAPTRRVGRALWRLRHIVPLTPLGLAVGAAGVWLSLSVAASETDYVLWAAGRAALAVVLAALALVMVAGLRVALAGRRLRDGRDVELESGLTGETGIRVPCMRGWPLVSVRMVWEEPREIEVTLEPRGGRCDELIRPALRGDSVRVRRRYLVEDIFGFARIGLSFRASQRVRVLPSRARVTAHLISRFLEGDALSHPDGPPDGELLEMRRYAHGDPLRHVLWKAFARTRKLLVRAPERAITPNPSAIAYFVAGPGDEPVAGAARFFVEEGLLGQEFLFGCDGAAEPAHDAEEALEQIIASARARDRGATGLHGFVGGLRAPQRTSCLLFVPPRPGRWLRRVEREVRRLPGVRVVSAVDAGIEAPRGGRLRRLLFRPEVDRQRTHRGLGEVLRRLRAAGINDLYVIHRPSGELLGPAQLEALMAREAAT